MITWITIDMGTQNQYILYTSKTTNYYTTHLSIIRFIKVPLNLALPDYTPPGIHETLRRLSNYLIWAEGVVRILGTKTLQHLINHFVVLKCMFMSAYRNLYIDNISVKWLYELTSCLPVLEQTYFDFWLFYFRISRSILD